MLLKRHTQSQRRLAQSKGKLEAGVGKLATVEVTPSHSKPASPLTVGGVAAGTAAARTTTEDTAGAERARTPSPLTETPTELDISDSSTVSSSFSRVEQESKPRKQPLWLPQRMLGTK